VRLDHLLSKEHVLRSLYTAPLKQPSCTDLFGSDSAHGWNIDIVTRKRSLLSVRPSGLEKTKPADLVFCTLLGPEGPGRYLRVAPEPLDLVVFEPGSSTEGTARILRTTQWTRAS
jgi:hypothetical protein